MSSKDVLFVELSKNGLLGISLSLIKFFISPSPDKKKKKEENTEKVLLHFCITFIGINNIVQAVTV